MERKNNMEKEFVKGMFIDEHKFDDGGSIEKLAINESFIRYYNDNKNEKGYLNIDIKRSKAGKLYLQKNTYVSKSKEQPIEDNLNDSIPF
jgi:hypothetical protein